MSSPGLSWDAMLKMTKINLDLISDIDMQLFIEKGIRGGSEALILLIAMLKPTIRTCKTIILGKKVVT